MVFVVPLGCVASKLEQKKTFSLSLIFVMFYAWHQNLKFFLSKPRNGPFFQLLARCEVNGVQVADFTSLTYHYIGHELTYCNNVKTTGS